MKLRILKLTLEQFAGLLQGKPAAFSAELPNDIEVLDTKVDLFTKHVAIVVRSDSFEDVDESNSVPEFALYATSSSAPLATSSAQEAKPTPKPAIPAPNPEPKQSLSPVMSASPPLSRYAAKMENEFSPEQRKLLSFTVKSDTVIVKPVAFLKAEWDDINDVVRSLGGRWVKGDIVSYWEIPLQ